MADESPPHPEPQPPRFALHHVGQLVADVPSTARDLVRCFGYVVESDVIEDPIQTAFVLFLRLPGALHWLELVAPNGPVSKLSRSLARGAGLHHLCYEVERIEAACEHLRERGMMMLAPPVPAVAFPGRRIVWFIDGSGRLVELVEAGEGPLSLRSCQAIA